jgi:hypothetical protein
VSGSVAGAAVAAAAAVSAAFAFASLGGSDDGAAATVGAARHGASGVSVAFRDVAAERGLRFRHGAFRFGVSADPVAMVGGGVCWLDYDGDGWLDLFVVNGYAESDRGEWKARGGLPASRLFRNVRGRFTDVTSASGAGLAVRGQGCVAADLDADGRTDLFVTTGERPALLWNEGDGTFVDGAEAAGVAAFGWHTGAAAGDLNGDGLPELVVAGYVDLNRRIPDATLGFPNTFAGRRDLLFVNEGAHGGGRPRFREAGVEAGLEAARFERGLGVVLFDPDRDGDLDAYVANDANPNRLYENVPWPGGAEADPERLGFRFEERAAAAGVADANSGMGVAAGDYDEDGRPDLFVTNARRQVHAAYRGRPPDGKEPSFDDVRAELGPPFTGSTGWGASWADLDLDADLDLVVANGDVPVTDLRRDAQPVQAFLNSGGRFAAVEQPLPSLLARGSAAADYDNDGDVDIAVISLGGRLALLENRGTTGNWLIVDLGGAAVGAAVTAVLPGGRTLVRQVPAGSSYLSSEDPRAHFGLGDARRIAELTVRWPDGATTRLRDLAANRLLVLERPS